MARSRARIAAVACAALALAPASAHAATVAVERAGTHYGRGGTYDTFRVAVLAGPGEANDVLVERVAGTSDVRVVDRGAPLEPGAGCAAADRGVVCPSNGWLYEVLVRTLDGDDAARAPGFFSTVRLEGGEGDDALEGPPTTSVLDGGPGADTLRGARVTYAGRTAPVTVTLDGVADDGEAGEGDLVDAAVTSVLGGEAGDLLVAGATRVMLDGGGGDDRVVGSPDPDTLGGGDGHDRLEGGAGDDSLLRDPGADVLRGGPGRDVVAYDVFPYVLAPVTVTLDDRPGDGPPGEHDDVGSDVEAVYATLGPATLVGNDGPNELVVRSGDGFVRAGGGDDRVEGGSDVDLGPGRDRLLRGSGTIRARDGEPDDIACFRASTVEADAIDTLRRCLRTVRFRRPPRVHRDGLLRLRGRCTPVAERCTGRVLLRGNRRVRLPNGRWYGVGAARRVSLPPGPVLVRLRLSELERRLLSRAGALEADLIFHPDAPAAARTVDPVVLRPPLRR
jgi:hypothetical protein